MNIVHQILEYAAVIMALVIVVLGVFYACTKVFVELILAHVMKAFDCWEAFIDYLLHRKKYKEWKLRKTTPPKKIKAKIKIEENGDEVFGQCEINGRKISQFGNSIEDVKKIMRRFIIEYYHIDIIEFEIQYSKIDF